MAQTFKYFYTTHYPHRWSSGPTVHTLNDSYEPIETLEQAKELALKNAVESYSDDRCVTTWGIMYSENN